jgi:hypothetical protein
VFPDTPWDLECDPSLSSCPQRSMSFFTPWRLASVQTKVWNPATSAYRLVDQFDLTGEYPDPMDGSQPNLWFGYFTGLDGAAVATALAGQGTMSRTSEGAPTDLCGHVARPAVPMALSSLPGHRTAGRIRTDEPDRCARVTVSTCGAAACGFVIGREHDGPSATVRYRHSTRSHPPAASQQEVQQWTRPPRGR